MIGIYLQTMVSIVINKVKTLFQLASFLLITFAQNTSKPIPLEWHEICTEINDSEVKKD